MSAAITLEQLINFLLGAPMFGDLDPSELSRIVHIMKVQYLRADQIVFREGNPGDAWYVVYEGSVEVFTGGGDDGAPERRLATLSPPACFGEMAILDGSPRSATVRASEASTVLKFPRSGFQQLLEEGNLAAYKLVYHMAKVLVSRQRGVTQRLVDVLGREEYSGVHEELSPIVEVASPSE
jgi:CRP-like cAMP-binding protein